MGSALDKVLDLMDQQCELHYSLVSILEDEKKAIEKVNLAELSEVNEKKETISNKMRSLEDQRLKALQNLAASLGQPVEGMTLKKLISLTDSPYSERLSKYRTRLQSFIRRITVANNLNKSLLTHCLNLVKGSIELLNNATSTNSVYYKTGRIRNYDKTGRIVCREI
ncbi:hypothetical protein PITCH_A1470017 [uncultured Desulfobacterium sp.]|uniref:FlgN protein n=1 Tax=uncultured Desulfobacterium sp. TaxID=201089 RepID=A0A445MT76_9BACT|nr:hypothetical protein PITCH_A1470017 [uncultured Desulfobacterium sp.]